MKHGKEVRNEKMIIEKADGKKIPVLVSSSPLFDERGKLVSSISIFEDITELKKAEDSLKESEEKLRTILNNSSDSISMFDLKTGKYVYFSPSTVEITGLTANEFNNKYADNVYEQVHPGDREIIIEQHKMLTSELGISNRTDVRWKCKNGEYHWFENVRKLIYDENEQPIAFIGFNHDINDQKEYEKRARS